MKTIKIIFSLLFISFLPIHAFAISKTQIDTLAQAFMKENQVEGMSIAVIDKGNTQIYNYGFANRSKNTLTNSQTLYAIASFTKTITATLAAIAASEGKLNLDNPFINYFPELEQNSNLKNITTRHLLGHVSSLPFDFQPQPQNYLAMVESLNRFIPPRDPGSAYAYSNAGIGTVGYVLQNAYDQDYEYLLQERILTPLDMHSTYLSIPAEKQANLSLGHDKNNKPVPLSSNPDVWFAAAALKSTISDMAKYLKAHIDSSTIKNQKLAQAISLAHENTYCFTDKKSCEQLAWQAHAISELNNSKGDSYFIDYDQKGNPLFDTQKISENKDFANNKIFIDKTCAGYGMSGYMAYIPDQKIGVVILINKFLGDARIRLGRDILIKA